MKMVCSSWKRCDNPCSDKYPHEKNVLCDGTCESQFQGRCVPISSIQTTITCPFCDETDFDLVGLKSHLVNGDCEAFNKIEGLSPSIRKDTEEAENETYECR